MSQFRKFETPINSLLPGLINELKNNSFYREGLGLKELGNFYFCLNKGLEWGRSQPQSQLRNEYISVCNDEMEKLKAAYSKLDSSGNITSWGAPKSGGRTRKRSTRGKSRRGKSRRGKSRKRARG